MSDTMSWPDKAFTGSPQLGSAAVPNPYVSNAFDSAAKTFSLAELLPKENVWAALPKALPAQALVAHLLSQALVLQWTMPTAYQPRHQNVMAPLLVA